jgi:hypothetical protein
MDEAAQVHFDYRERTFNDRKSAKFKNNAREHNISTVSLWLGLCQDPLALQGAVKRRSNGLRG